MPQKSQQTQLIYDQTK